MRGILLLSVAAVVLTNPLSAAAQGPESGNPDDFLWLLKYEKTKAKLSADFQKMLDRLRKSKLPDPDAATRAANQWRFASDGGILAQEGVKVAGLVRLGRDVPQFGGKGDLVWVVRLVHPVDGVTQELWLNSGTGAVRALLPPREKKG
jgi:hypothetical protein